MFVPRFMYEPEASEPLRELDIMFVVAIDDTLRVRPREFCNVWHQNWHWTESHDKGASRQGALNDVTGSRRHGILSKAKGIEALA